MDKRTLAQGFRDRFAGVVELERPALSAFLNACGIDRSALSQFLDPGNDRLPRAETLRRIAEVSGVSVDWLLCLENAPEGRQEMTSLGALEAETTDDGKPMIAQWHAESGDAKLRYVPLALPDGLNLIAAETAPSWKTGSEVRTEAILDGFDLADRDMEIAMSVQALQDLSEQTGLWRGAPRDLCRRQLLHMADVCADHYPTLRLHLYDGADIYAPPFTVFGRKRVAIYVGDAYLSLTGPEQVRMFARRFDALVRAARVRPDAVPDWLRDIAR